MMETLPDDYQQRQQKTLRKRQIAQAIAQQAMGPLPQNERFGRYVKNNDMGNALANAAQLYFANKGLGEADTEDANLARQIQEEQGNERKAIAELMAGRPGVRREQQGPVLPGETLPPIIEGAMPADPRKAIAAAMSSKFGNIQAMGAQMQKDQQTQLMEQAKMLGAADPVRGIAHMQGGDPRAQVAPIVQPPIEFGTSPSGAGYGVIKDTRGGKPTLTFEPKETRVNTYVGGKAEVELDKINMEQLSKSRADIADIPIKMSNIKRITELMDQGADTGGGASWRQAVRQFGNNFNVRVPETGLTGELQSKLGENVLAGARALAPVTENDVDLLKEILGSVDKDPNALRELNAMLLAKQLLTIDRHNSQVDTVAATNPELRGKYEPLKVSVGDKLPMTTTTLRALQILKENGHDTSRYEIEGQSANDVELDIQFNRKPVELRAPPAGRGRRVQ